MSRALADVGRAELLQTAGVFEDGWCEPVARVTAKAQAPLTRLQLTVWLKPETGASRAPMRISLNDSEQLSAQVAFNLPTVIQVSCRAGAGEMLTVEVACEHEVQNKGGDLRRLAFLMSALHFS